MGVGYYNVFDTSKPAGPENTPPQTIITPIPGALPVIMQAQAAARAAAMGGGRAPTPQPTPEQAVAQKFNQTFTPDTQAALAAASKGTPEQRFTFGELQGYGAAARQQLFQQGQTSIKPAQFNPNAQLANPTEVARMRLDIATGMTHSNDTRAQYSTQLPNAEYMRQLQVIQAQSEGRLKTVNTETKNGITTTTYEITPRAINQQAPSVEIPKTAFKGDFFQAIKGTITGEAAQAAQERAFESDVSGNKAAFLGYSVGAGIAGVAAAPYQILKGLFEVGQNIGGLLARGQYTEAAKQPALAVYEPAAQTLSFASQGQAQATFTILNIGTGLAAGKLAEVGVGKAGAFANTQVLPRASAAISRAFPAEVEVSSFATPKLTVLSGEPFTPGYLRATTESESGVIGKVKGFGVPEGTTITATGKGTTVFTKVASEAKQPLIFGSGEATATARQAGRLAETTSVFGYGGKITEAQGTIYTNIRGYAGSLQAKFNAAFETQQAIPGFPTKRLLSEEVFTGRVETPQGRAVVRGTGVTIGDMKLLDIRRQAIEVFTSKVQEITRGTASLRAEFGEPGRPPASYVNPRIDVTLKPTFKAFIEKGKPASPQVLGAPFKVHPSELPKTKPFLEEKPLPKPSGNEYALQVEKAKQIFEGKTLTAKPSMGQAAVVGAKAIEVQSKAIQSLLAKALPSGKIGVVTPVIPKPSPQPKVPELKFESKLAPLIQISGSRTGTQSITTIGTTEKGKTLPLIDTGEKTTPAFKYRDFTGFIPAFKFDSGTKTTPETTLITGTTTTQPPSFPSFPVLPPLETVLRLPTLSGSGGGSIGGMPALPAFPGMGATKKPKLGKNVFNPTEPYLSYSLLHNLPRLALPQRVSRAYFYAGVPTPTRALAGSSPLKGVGKLAREAGFKKQGFDAFAQFVMGKKKRKR